MLGIKKALQKQWKQARRNYLKKEKPPKEPRPLTAEQIYLVCVFCMLNVFDYFMTLLSLQLTKGSPAEVVEANGFVATLFAEGRILEIMFIKFGFTALAAYLIIHYLRTTGRSYDRIRASLMFLVTIYILLIIHNIIQLNLVIGWNGLV